MGFLKALKANLQQPLLIVRNGLRAHHLKVIRDYLDSTGHFQVASLLPHAPDLNPVEYLLARFKRHALASYCPNALSALGVTARNKLKSTQQRSSVIVACWMQAELAI